MTIAESFDAIGLDPGDRPRWIELVDSSASREVFAHPGYLGLFETEGAVAVCLCYRVGDARAFYPLLLRDLRAVPFWGRERDAVYDAVSPPYGYGGPYVEGAKDRAAFVERFFRAYGQWARKQKIVSEYLIFSPKEPAPLSYPGQVEVRAPTVVRDLGISADELWMSYKGSVRTDVKTALRNGIEIEIDQTGSQTIEFLNVYAQTMDRRQAAASYRIDLSFLTKLNASLGSYFAYFHALNRGTIVSTELTLVSGDSTFFFRGGTLRDSLGTRANLLLKHRIIEWSRERGKRCYLLGGGNDPEDSLFKYKRSFAPQGVRPLQVGKWTTDPALYANVLAARRSHEADRGRVWRPLPGYFPEYRAPAAEAA